MQQPLGPAKVQLARPCERINQKTRGVLASRTHSWDRVNATIEKFFFCKPECDAVFYFVDKMFIKLLVFSHRCLLLGGVWLVLTGAELKGLAVGAFAVPATTWLSLRMMPPRQPLRVWRLVLHLPSFLAGSVLGGLDVARRALAVHMPLKPGWVEAPARLPDGGRVFLGGELSLMPGTLAAGMYRDRLLVHLLDTGAGFENAIPREEAAIAAMLWDDAQTERSQ